MSTNKLLLIVFVLFLQTYNWFVKAQKQFLEPFFITDSTSINEWIEQEYGNDVRSADELITDGTIRASEIIVSTTGADFVFADDYEITPIE